MASLEFSLVVVSIVVSLMLVSFAGRVSEVSGSVLDATAEAARTASLHQQPNLATEAAQKSAEAALKDVCMSFEITTNTDNFEPGGFVEVDIKCKISLVGLSLLSIPGEMTLQFEATEIIDRHRARSAL